MPTVAVFQTDVAGFAESYGAGVMSRAAWAWTRHLHGKADRTLAPSTSAMENLVAHRVPRVHHWGRGVDVTGFVPSARDDALRSAWSPAGKPIVGFVGTAGTGEARRTAGGAWPTATTFNWSIVGDGVDRAKLESLMPSAVFTGALYGAELAAAYASMDVFVHAGEHETFCQAVQEAMASGVPVIAPDAGGPRDLVTPMHTGLLLAGRRVRGQAARCRRPSARRAAALFGGGQAQRAEPHLARGLRSAARPLRGGARPARRQGGLTDAASA